MTQNWTYDEDLYSQEPIPGIIKLGNDGGCGDPACCGLPQYHIELSLEHRKLIVSSVNRSALFEEIVGHLEEMFSRDDDYGCGFYGDPRWREAYEALRALLRRAREATK